MKKIKIIFKPEMIATPSGEMEPYQKPPFETTLENLPNQERLHGNKIKEVIHANGDGSWPEKKVAQSSVYKPKFTLKDVTPEIKAILFKEFETTFVPPMLGVITNEVLIKEFRKRGKTDLSISKYLELDIKEIQKVI